MRLILTHEQADFDALASLLGGFLLDESAVPVLPRRINRNGRTFLTLYSTELPFIDPRDLPADTIDAILLVDTQSLVTLKGLNKQTQVQVIDHHKPRPGLDARWQFTSGITGACTTLLVESLQESGSPLSMIQATLLLLGIYEDTGSLTYASTTPRDVRAAAYLLEQGANLHLLAEFLNPPLSSEQRRAYELLLDTAETFTIQGQRVIIARADAVGMDDEISSVAHKLRDLLDPDALFLLVNTGEGIRLVARSTTDRINVAEITKTFGGGGHERAASALLRATPSGSPAEEAPSLESLRQALLEILPKHIQPAITVGQIMSRRPRLLAPDTSLQEAVQLMQRYGYEGYPVIKDGQVVGLLTRRAVDKATAHRLNLNTGSLMEGGKFSVTASDPLETLQQVMTSSGWGQVPVIDPASGEVIGIVTRTDLLKTLTRQTSHSEVTNLTSRLETAMPAARLELLKAVAAQAHAQHMAVYIVGGFVRDLLMERPGLDFDVVVEGDAIALSRSLAADFGGHTVTHNRFGTAKWFISEKKTEIARRLGLVSPDDIAQLPQTLDLISARREFYDHPTALPTIERSSIKQDLHRRDFTINTMALRLDGKHYGELHDTFGGLSDLRKGLVRVLHSLSFVDDPTRLLRAVRFEQRFGFKIEARTLDLMKEALSMLKHVSGERLHHEFDLILAEERAAVMLARLDELGILAAIDAGLPADADLASLLPIKDPAEHAPGWGLPSRLGGIPAQRALAYLAWLCRLPQDTAERVCSRLKLAGSLCQALQNAIHLCQDLPKLAGMPASQVVDRLEDVPLLAIYAVYLVNSDETLNRPLELFTKSWRYIQANSDGNTLLARGLTPSPIFSDILAALRRAWLDGRVQSAQEEEALLDSLIKQWNLLPG